MGQAGRGRPSRRSTRRALPVLDWFSGQPPLGGGAGKCPADRRATGLPRDSVANVSQLVALELVLAGIDTVLAR